MNQDTRPVQASPSSLEVVHGRTVRLGVNLLIVFLAWILFVIGLFVVVVRAWRDGTASLSMVAPLLASFVPLLAIPVAVLFPGDLAYVAFLALPLSAIGWSWIAIAWFRGHGAWLSTP